MINHFFLIFSIISVYEFLRYLKLINILMLNLNIYRKILILFKLKKVSDFRKEKLMYNYSKSLFIVSIKLFFIFFCIFIFLLILDLLSGSFFNLFFSILGIIEMSLIFIIYHLLRIKIYAKL